MFLRRATDFILQSRTHAMAIAFLLAFLPVIGGIGILIAALVTLRKSVIEGAWVTLAATLPAIISYFAFPVSAEQADLSLIMLVVLVVCNALTWLFAVVLRRYENWGFVLELGALVGVMIVILVHALHPDIQGWWSVQLTNYFAKTADKMEKMGNGAKSLPPETQQQMVAAIKQMATGLIVISLLANTLLQLVIARWWQAALYNPGGLRKELYKIKLSHFIAALFVIFLVFAYWGYTFALDALPILCTVFFVAGLSLIHDSVSLTKNTWVWLLLIYGAILWLFPLSFLMIAGLALLDAIVNFRKRLRYKF